MEYVKYDPEWLVKLAENEFPDEEWKAEAFRNCTECYFTGDTDIDFKPVPNKLKKDTEYPYLGFNMDAGDGIGIIEVGVDKKEYCVTYIYFFTKVMEDEEDPQYWRYTEQRRRKKETEEDIEADLTRKDGFLGVVSKSGGTRSSRKAPETDE